MEFKLLGLLEVVSDQAGVVPVAPGKESALLALLLLHANEPVSVDRLVEELWAGERPANEAKTVQIYVSRLRKRLDTDRLHTTAGGYVVRTEPGEIDIERFEALVREGRQALEQGRAEKALELLTAALELWRGPPLADFRFDAYAQAEIRRLEELHDAVAADRFDARLALGEGDELLPELEPLARASPVNERLQGQLMLCLYRCGRQADALDVYARARAALVDELGIEPGRRLRDLQQAILRQDPGLDATVPRLAAVEARRPFVGRERELAELEGRLDAAFTGHGSLALLVGEPGIGKSRLAEELAVRARSRGAAVIVGRCWEAGGAPAYWPWVQSLRSYVQQTDPVTLREQLGSGAGEVAQLLPEVAAMFDDLPAPVPSESESARFRLFDAISQFLRRAAESRPIVLGLDDLHAADAPSLLLLRFLARELASAQVLVVAAYRDVDPAPTETLTSLLAELAREPVVLRLPLHGLDSDAVAEYVEQTASELASPALTEALTASTEGNPLFVGEILRLFVREGKGPKPTTALAVPQSIRDVIGRRIALLPEASSATLPAAAVLGREFPLDVLAHMSDLSENDLLDVLDAAVSARVLAEVPGTPGRIRFAHVLIRDTLYDGLTPTRRMRLHRKAVEVLESLHGDALGPHLAELAHHAIAGQELDKGLSYARRAGDRALDLLAYEEAARLYETALAAASPDDEPARCGILLALGEARSRAGDSSHAKESFLAAASIAERTGLGRELARAAVGYGGRMVVVRAGADDQLIPLLERGLRALPADEIELRAQLLGRLAGALRSEPSRARRDALSREALELARASGNDVALAFALDGRAGAMIAPDTIDEYLGLGTDLLAVGERIGDRERVLQGHSYRVMANLTLGNLEAALYDIEARRPTADALGQPVALWQITTDDGMLALFSGGLEEAEALVEEAFVPGKSAIPELAIPAHGFQRYLLHDLRGGLDRIEPEMREVVAAHPARRVFAGALAHIQARQGRLADAGLELDKLAQDNFRHVHFDQEWLLAMSLLAETTTLLDRSDLAEELYELIEPFGALNTLDLPEGMRGSMARYLGQLATLLQRWNAAETHFEEALARNESMGALPWLALSRSDYGRMLLARGASGDRERAESLLAAASEAFRELGITGYV